MTDGSRTVYLRPLDDSWSVTRVAADRAASIVHGARDVDVEQLVGALSRAGFDLVVQCYACDESAVGYRSRAVGDERDPACARHADPEGEPLAPPAEPRPFFFRAEGCRQACKLDLVDVARALGADADAELDADRLGVGALRRLIGRRLQRGIGEPHYMAGWGRQVTKADLVGVARALGEHAAGKNSTVDALRASIATRLQARAARRDAAIKGGER